MTDVSASNESLILVFTASPLLSIVPWVIVRATLENPMSHNANNVGPSAKCVVCIVTLLGDTGCLKIHTQGV